MNKEFYEALGHLFYAVIACDGVNHELEVDLIEEESQNYSSKALNSAEDTSYKIILDTFKYLDYNKVKWQIAWNVFEHYVKQNPSTIPKSLSNQIKQSVARIGAAKNGLNKGELVLISKLSLLFQSTIE